MRQLDFNKFEDEAWEDRIPLLPWGHYLDMENLGASRPYGTWTPSAHPVHGSSPLSCQYGDKLAGKYMSCRK